MPKVNGKRFAYTTKGKEKAAQAKKAIAKPVIKKKRTKPSSR